jgi:chromosome segregation protein
MTPLNRIVIQGFKSFKRKTSIPIPCGFSIFTGPNGSGKTNIVDAISFVLGMSSSRTMRATKAQDLIFQGSRKKSGSEFARVSLYFNNSKRVLPYDEEVALSRRVNSKGVSTYRLNGRIVSRQEIVDTMALIGIKSDGHNIIRQGDVTRIVEMDAIERRKIIDDISGIGEYDEKKSKAEKELEKIEQKIRDAELILNEKTSIITKLRSEREAALFYQKLESDLRKIKTSITRKSYDSAQKSLEETNRKLTEKEVALKNVQEKIASTDKEIEAEEAKIEALTKNVLKARDQIESAKKTAAKEAEVERLRDRIEMNRKEILRLETLSNRLRSMDASPAVKAVLGNRGVHGTVARLISVPARYSVAVEVSAGRQLQNVVVDSSATAVSCIRQLKAGKIGRAKFLPLDRLQAQQKLPLPSGAIGWLSDLIKYDGRYSAVVSYMFGRTACVQDIEVANRIVKSHRVRMITLDGDLVEASGAMTGGFYRKQNLTGEIRAYEMERCKLEDEIRVFEKRTKEIEEELSKLRPAEDEAIGEVRTAGVKARLAKLREQRREAYDRSVGLQQEIQKLNVQKAKMETKTEDMTSQIGEEEDLKQFIDIPMTRLHELERESLERLATIGHVNLKAIDDFETFKTEFDEFKDKVDRIVAERQSILNAVKEIEARRMETFNACLSEISRNFREVYRELTGGEATLELADLGSMDSGLLIKAQFPGKKLLHIDAMSGGEKTLTAFTFVFATQRHKAMPFYILDEADAALDKKNTELVSRLIKKHSKDVQFIAISHNDTLIKEADQVYGISMQDGESKAFGIKLPEN